MDRIDEPIIKCSVSLGLRTKNERERTLFVEADWGRFELTRERLEELREIVAEGDLFFGKGEVKFVRMSVRDDYEPNHIPEKLRASMLSI